MSKPIINGIDVSECDYFEKQHIEDMYESDDCNVCIDNYCALCWKECEKYNGCYYKQLKRLQKENKKLKEILSQQQELDNEIEALSNEDKYKQALEEIRESILSRYSIDKNKEIIARPLEDLWCIKKLIDEVLND